jgi:hypothetical protein
MELYSWLTNKPEKKSQRKLENTLRGWKKVIWDVDEAVCRGKLIATNTNIKEDLK